MKFNWGFGVVCICAGFVIFMSALVYRATQEKVEFVTDRYYEKELRFQQQIDDQQNLVRLDQPLEVRYVKSENAVEINYPVQAGNNVNGSLMFYKPDDARLDFTVGAKADGQHRQLISAANMKAGWWTVKLDWKSGGQSFYHEEKILVE